MAKLDQKFNTKSGKSKFNMDYEDDFQDLSSSRKKKRRVARQRYDSPEFSQYDYEQY